jgi:hypothetical protein
MNFEDVSETVLGDMECSIRGLVRATIFRNQCVWKLQCLDSFWWDPEMGNLFMVLFKPDIMFSNEYCLNPEFSKNL